MLDFFGPAIIQSTLSPAPDLQAFPAVQLPFTGANIIAFPEVAACIIAMSVELVSWAKGTAQQLVR